MQHGYFPATPIKSPVVTSNVGTCPVWVDSAVVRFCEYTQYESKHETSVTAMASALMRQHRAACPERGQHGSLKVLHLDERQLKRYLGLALREHRHMTLSVRQMVLNAMHPKDQLGYMLRGCPCCSQGLKSSQVQVPPDSKAPNAQQGESPGSDASEILMISKVRFTAVSWPSMSASRRQGHSSGVLSCQIAAINPA